MRRGRPLYSVPGIADPRGLALIAVKTRASRSVRDDKILTLEGYVILDLGLLHLYQADTVSVYQRIRLFVCENRVKTADSDTYQEIPDTRFKHS